jgi:carbon starvation protein
MPALYLVVVSALVAVIAYRTYGAFLAAKVATLDDLRSTPAHTRRDGHDYVPTHPLVLFGHHFAAIAGAGPLIGPVLAAQFGYLPGFLWLLVGSVLAGGVHDFVILMASVRRGGRSLANIARDEVSPLTGAATAVAIVFVMVVALAAMALVVTNALRDSAWGVVSIALTIPIALAMGLWSYKIRPGSVRTVTVVGVILLLLAVASGAYVQHAPFRGWFIYPQHGIAIGIMAYGFIASVLPVWLLLCPRDYLSSFMKIGAVLLLAVGVILVNPHLRMPAITPFIHGGGPVFPGALFPFVFITIACGAISGFHSLIASGTTPKMIDRERHILPISYGAMVLEGFVGVIALIAACALHPSDYFAINARPEIFATLGMAVRDLPALERQVGESLAGRPGGAVSLAVGMAKIFSSLPLLKGLMGFWYHFAIMFEALFILTTVDAGTRVGRFMLQDTIGNVYRPMRDVSWKPGVWVTSAAVVGAWGYFLYTGVTNPLGGINQLFPLFGIANQLLAAIALTVCTTLLIKHGKLKWAWVTGIPLAWDATVTLTASWQKVFSDSPTLGFFAQRARYQEALDAGKVLAPAKSLEAMQTVVTNSIVDGILAAFFALLVVIIIADAVRVWIRALRSPAPLPTTEAPHTESLITAPSGLLGGVGEDRRELAGTGRRTP